MVLPARSSGRHCTSRGWCMLLPTPVAHCCCCPLLQERRRPAQVRAPARAAFEPAGRCHGSRCPPAMAAGAAYLGGQLLAGRLATGGLAGGLLGAGHCDGLKLLRVGGAGCDRGWMAFRGIAMGFEGRGGGQLRAAFGPGSRGEAGSALAPPRRQQEAGPPAALQSPVVAFQSPYNAPTHTR